MSKFCKECERLAKDKQKLIEYVRVFGWCGHEGSFYSNKPFECAKCGDNSTCNKYKLLKEVGE